jgi:tRNA/tmRNA/rRNA uracil-C5-methylase (TrmA/RlmC/RlmD family)
VTRRPREREVRGRSLVGEEHDVEVGPVAHGGHCVARLDATPGSGEGGGRVVFVRHTLPGERVTVRITDGDEESRFLRGDAVAVLEASSDRVDPPCPWSGPGRCGGCDFQHVALGAQRALKAAVVREQLQRLAGLDVPVTVEAVPGDNEGLGWRTRLQFAVDSTGRAGLRKHHSHDIVPVDVCPIGHPDLPEVGTAPWPAASSVEAIVSAAGEKLRIIEARGRTSYDGPRILHEHAAGRDWEVSGSAFWQVHPGAGDTLVAAVLGALEPRPGEHAADLYSGVGLFSAALAERVGDSGRVVAVEGDRTAVADAERNLGDLPQVEHLVDRVDRALAHGKLGGGIDLVVLDPPRTGAKRKVVDAVADLGPRAVAYVACDPAALARDVAIFAERGYRLAGLRAFDIFPMTHHVECVALLERS